MVDAGQRLLALEIGLTRFASATALALLGQTESPG